MTFSSRVTERLIIFVKAPRPGTVKTRIARSAGVERACAIYRALLDRVTMNLAEIEHSQLRFTPDDAADEVAPWLKENWSAKPQGPGNLGERMHRAFKESFSAGAGRVVIVGSDCPEITARDVRGALSELDSSDVVLGPAVDGGYWLIGLRAAQPELFREIPWSSDQVLAQTLCRAKNLRLRIQLMRILADIDTGEDWDAYVREMR